MNCLYCDNPIAEKPYGKKAKYCSRNCWLKHYREMQKDATVRVCIICGKNLTGRDRKTCKGECRIEYARQRQAEHKTVYISKYDVYAERLKKRKPTVSTAEINAAARVKNMSYGQFTARYINAPTADVNITKHQKWAVFNLGEGEVIATTGRDTVVGNYKEIQLHIARETGKKKEEVVI